MRPLVILHDSLDHRREGLVDLTLD